MARSRSEIAFLAIALLGLLVASYGLYLHGAPTGSSICDINGTFNCDKVNKSPWSEIFGIPVALLGMVSYALLLIATLKGQAIARMLDFTRRDLWQYLLLATCVMLAFQAYLTAVEIFIIHAYCLICLVSQACVIALAAIAFGQWRSAK